MAEERQATETIQDAQAASGTAALRPSSKAVLALIKRCLRNSGRNGVDVAWPSQETIVRDTGFAPRSVSRAIADLRGAGLIVVCRARGKGARGNLYRLANPHATGGVSYSTDFGDSPHATGGDSPHATGGVSSDAAPLERVLVLESVNPDPLEQASAALAVQQAQWNALAPEEQAAATAALRSELPLWDADTYPNLGLLLHAYKQLKAEQAVAAKSTPPQPIDETSSAAMAVEWRWRKRGGLSLEFDSEANLGARFDHMKRRGVAGETILAAMRDADRDPVEPIWEFQNLLLPKSGNDPYAGLKDFVGREAT